jgi:hypothetical protein
VEVDERKGFGKGLNDAGEGFLSVTSDTFEEFGLVVGENRKSHDHLCFVFSFFFLHTHLNPIVKTVFVFQVVVLPQTSRMAIGLFNKKSVQM